MPNCNYLETITLKMRAGTSSETLILVYKGTHIHITDNYNVFNNIFQDPRFIKLFPSIIV
jgi:hypothetical protein